MRLRNRIRYLARRRRLDADLAEELRLHREMAENAALRAGATPEDARREANLAFGSEAIALENLALGYIGLGQSGPALRSLIEARGLAQTIHDQERLFSLDLVEIELLLAEGKLESVFGKLAKAAEVMKKSKYASEAPRFLRLSADAEIKAGRREEALKTLKKGLEECRKQKNRPEEARMVVLQKMLAE